MVGWKASSVVGGEDRCLVDHGGIMDRMNDGVHTRWWFFMIFDGWKQFHLDDFQIFKRFSGRLWQEKGPYQFVLMQDTSDKPWYIHVCCLYDLTLLQQIEQVWTDMNMHEINYGTSWQLSLWQTVTISGVRLHELLGAWDGAPVCFRTLGSLISSQSVMAGTPKIEA